MTQPASPDLPRRAWVEQVMGLPISVHVRGDAALSPNVDRAVLELFESLRRADQRFSTYRADSEVSARRRGQAARPSADMLEVLALCDQARALTRGAFDADLPGGFDPSGLVKGWAVERATGPLREAAGGSDWLVNAGGDILLHAEAGRTWRGGVEDPPRPGPTPRAPSPSRGASAPPRPAPRGGRIPHPQARPGPPRA